MSVPLQKPQKHIGAFDGLTVIVQTAWVLEKV